MTVNEIIERPWFGLKCALQLCGHIPAHDDTGCWGECPKCEHRAGFVTREELCRYADREIARELKARSRK